MYAFAKTSLWLCLFCLVVSFPTYELFFEPNDIVAPNWQALQLQADNPLQARTYPADKHESQLAFRLLLPSIAYLFHVPIGWFFGLMPVAGWGFFTLLQQVFKRAGLSPWDGLLVSLGLAATYVGKAFFSDTLGYFDAFSYLFLLIAIRVRLPAYAIAAYILSFYVDERAYVAAPLAAFARWWLWNKLEGSVRIPALLKEVAVVVAAIMLGLGIRWWLHSTYRLESGGRSEVLGLNVLRSNYQIASLGFYAGLDFWMLVAFLPIYYLIIQKQRLVGVGYVMYVLAAILVMYFMLDLSRCLAYLFPAVLAGVFALAKYEKPAFTERVLAFFCGTALLLPPLFIVGHYILWMGPIIPRIFKLAAKVWLHADV